MSDISVEVKGLDALIRKLNQATPKGYARATMRAAVELLKGKIAKYPPASEANSPGSAPGSKWYERGRGGHYIRKRDGGHSIYATSKQLGRKWTTSVAGDGMSAKVGNNVSYAPYVQDKKEQTSYHAARGWVTVQDVAKDEADAIAKLFAKRIEEALRK